MKKLIIALVLIFGVGSVTALTACKVKDKRHKKHKKWKKKHKRHKKWKKRHKRHKRKAERVKLKAFFGDNTSVYLAWVPARIGQKRSMVKDWFGRKGKRKFKCDDGKYTVKAKYDDEDKVKEIKVFFKIDKATIVEHAKKKWGEPKKVNEKRIKWVKEGLKIIVKRKGNKTKLVIKKNKKKGAKSGKASDGMKPAKGGMAAAKGGMKPAMGLPDADDDDDDDDDD